jgi:hypothetical protein
MATTAAARVRIGVVHSALTVPRRTLRAGGPLDG